MLENGFLVKYSMQHTPQTIRNKRKLLRFYHETKIRLLSILDMLLSFLDNSSYLTTFSFTILKFYLKTKEL